MVEKLKLKRRQKAFNCPKCKTPLEIEYKHFDSGAKGGRYEAQKATDLSMAMYGQKDFLTKVPGSGGWTAIYPYDIYPAKVDPVAFPFGIECKHRKGWSIAEIIRNKTSKPSKKRKADIYILDWWNQLVEDIETNKDRWGSKEPLLVMRRDGEKGDLIVTKKSFAQAIGITSMLCNDEIAIFDWQDFLTFCRSKKWD